MQVFVAKQIIVSHPIIKGVRVAYNIESCYGTGTDKATVKAQVIRHFRGVNRSDRAAWAAAKKAGVVIHEVTV